MTLGITDIILLFGIFCAAWILVNILLEFIKGKIMIRFQNQRMDAFYAKLVRIILQASKDYKALKGGDRIDNQM